MMISGLRLEELYIGETAIPVRGARVAVRHTGYLKGGDVFATVWSILSQSASATPWPGSRARWKKSTSVFGGRSGLARIWRNGSRCLRPDSAKREAGFDLELLVTE
jgi:hypothetical protein